LLAAFIAIQLFVFLFKAEWLKALLPVLTLSTVFISWFLFNYKNKTFGLGLLVLFFTVIYTVRPLIVGPVWCTVLSFLVTPLFIINVFKFSSSKVKWINLFYLAMAIINLICNYYVTTNGSQLSLVSELLFLVPAFIIFQYLIKEYKASIITLIDTNNLKNYYLESIFSTAPIMIYTLDAKQKYQIVNKAYLYTTGYREEELIGKTKKELFKETRYERIAVTLNEDEKLLSGEIAEFSGSRRIQMKPTKKWRWYAFKKVPIKSSSDEITGVLCIMNDITELIKKQEILDVKNEELQKYIDSNLQLESFAFLASHDLKTPLRSISGFSQLLKKKAIDKLNEEEKEYLQYIIESSHNMNALIADLLTYSTINKAEFNVTKIDVEQLIESVKNDLKISTIENEVKIKIIEKEFNTINGDQILLKQLFNNLFSNAIKYKKDNVKPNINVSCIKKINHYLFKVSDNGIGIEEEYFSKIFLLLKRLHSSDAYEGTGIGLAICKQIVEKHGGKIWVESTINEGSTFYFTIDADGSDK